MMDMDDISNTIVQHELWLKSSGSEGVQLVVEDRLFSKMHLSDLNLASVEIPGARFIDCILHNVDFYGANLASAEFRDCRIEKCTFTKANLDYARFEGGDLRDTDFFRASLYEAAFGAVTFANVRFEKVFAEGARGLPDSAIS